MGGYIRYSLHWCLLHLEQYVWKVEFGPLSPPPTTTCMEKKYMIELCVTIITCSRQWKCTLVCTTITYNVNVHDIENVLCLHNYNLQCQCSRHWKCTLFAQL